MFYLYLADTSTPPDMSWLGPTVATIGSLIIAIVGFISIIIGKRQDRKNSKADSMEAAGIAIAPKVTDGWDEVRAARAEATKYYNLYRAFENVYYIASTALRHLARSVRETHPEMTFDQDIADALATDAPDTSEAMK